METVTEKKRSRRSGPSHTGTVGSKAGFLQRCVSCEPDFLDQGAENAKRDRVTRRYL
jgi:hypothetical protein